MSDSARPKPLFFIVHGLVVITLLGYGFRKVLFPPEKADKPGIITADDLRQASGTEAPDPNVPTTVKECNYSGPNDTIIKFS